MKKLPLDVSTYKTMVTDGYLYVDKTKRIYDLITSARYYFLSRPRRFGKTLLVSTLKEIFLGNKHLFKDVWIGQSCDYSWPVHPVIDLNFSKLDVESPVEFKKSLSWRLDRIGQSYGLDTSSAHSPGLKLQFLVEELSQQNKVVVLIDEYDYPIISNLDNIAIAQQNQKVMKNFFSVLKSLDPYLRCIFITGVTKFSKTSIFSGLNNLKDLTTHPSGALLLGYTSEEITSFFKEHIEDFARDKKKTEATILKNMREWYNGYRFSDKDVKVYNPYSVLHYLEDRVIKNYWLESGTPSFLIEFLKKRHESLEHLELTELSSLSLGTIEIDSISFIPILFQTGYLTIRSYDEKTGKYILDFPNAEVRESFNKYLLAGYVQTNLPTVEKVTSLLNAALKENNVPLFCSTLERLFAHIPYNLHINEERYYHSLFQLLGSLLSYNMQSEVMTDKGRIDLVLSSDTHHYIFELKLNSNADVALKQIEDKKYYEKYLLDKKKVVLVGLSFNKKGGKLQFDCEYNDL